MSDEKQVTALAGSWTERRSKYRSAWTVPFVWFERQCEKVEKILERIALLKILENLGRFSVVVGVILYVSECGDRLKQRQYQAWQVIYAGQGKIGSGGRTFALEDLNRDKVSLRELDLSKAQLTGVRLQGADLYAVNLAGASLFGASLDAANLEETNLKSSVLVDASLMKADLNGAHLIDSYLTGAVLDGAQLRGASIVSAALRYTSMTKADFHAGFQDVQGKYGEFGTNIRTSTLINSSFAAANLDGADFSGALLYNTSFEAASVQKANFSKAVIRSGAMVAADFRGTNFANAQFGTLPITELNQLLAKNGSAHSLGGGASSDYEVVQFEYSDLRDVNFEKAQFDSIDLTSVDLRGANLKDVTGWRSIRSLKAANVYGIKNAPPGFLTWAVNEMGALSEPNDAVWIKIRREQSPSPFYEKELTRSVKYHPELRNKRD